MGVDWLHSGEIQEEAMRKVAVVAIAALVLSLAAMVTVENWACVGDGGKGDGGDAEAR